ncbi:MAG: hypothetical protein ABSE19_08755 [Candidatus Acidiferrum sp.]
MAKKESISVNAMDEVLSGVVLSQMRRYEDPKRDKGHLDGLAAALVYCNMLGLELPDWVKARLGVMQLLTVSRRGHPRQNKLRRKMVTFFTDLMRYACVLLCDGEKHPDRYVKMNSSSRTC